MKKIKTRKSIILEDVEDLVYAKIKTNRFKQQRLPAWRPVPTLTSVFLVYLIVGFIFLALGIIIYIYSDKIKQITYEYGEECYGQPICNITIQINETMEKTIMVYYQLDGFFQNHRRYLSSKSISQLTGDKSVSIKNIKNSGDCSPIISNKDMNFTVNATSLDDLILQPDELAIPCGLMAKSFFNDTYLNWTLDDEEFFPNETGIALEKDRELHRFEYNESLQWTSMTDEHFLVWMRPAFYTNFKKLWARIDRDFKNGSNLALVIENNYDVSRYDGKKYLVFSTTNILGGKNYFLAIAYMVVGGVSLILSVVFFISGRKQKQNRQHKED